MQFKARGHAGATRPGAGREKSLEEIKGHDWMRQSMAREKSSRAEKLVHQFTLIKATASCGSDAAWPRLMMGPGGGVSRAGLRWRACRRSPRLAGRRGRKSAAAPRWDAPRGQGTRPPAAAAPRVAASPAGSGGAAAARARPCRLMAGARRGRAMRCRGPTVALDRRRSLLGRRGLGGCTRIRGGGRGTGGLCGTAWWDWPPSACNMSRATAAVRAGGRPTAAPPPPTAPAARRGATQRGLLCSAAGIAGLAARRWGRSDVGRGCGMAGARLFS
jgi:hypothetical protein